MTAIIRIWAAASPSPGSVPSGASGEWSLLWGILLFAAILLFSYLGLRWMKKRNMLGGHGRYMTVLDRMSVSRDCALLIVRILDGIYAVAVAKENVELLCKLDSDEFEAYEPPPKTPPWRRRTAEPQPSRAAPEQATVSVPDKPAPMDAQGKKDTFLRRFAHNFAVNSGMLPKDTPARRPGTASGGTPSGSFAEALENARSDASDVPPAPEETAANRVPPAPSAHRDYNALFEGIRSSSETGGARQAPRRAAPPAPAHPPAHGRDAVPPTRTPDLSAEDPLGVLRDRMAKREMDLRDKRDTNADK